MVKPLRPHPLSVGQARNFCTRRLTSVLDDRNGAPEVVQDVATIASELVTNAVIAGSSAIELSLQLRGDGVVIDVSDDADGEVLPVTPSPTDVKGRGLLIVAALSREWGVTSDDGTKHVWAEVDLGPGHAQLTSDRSGKLLS